MNLSLLRDADCEPDKLIVRLPVSEDRGAIVSLLLFPKLHPMHIPPLLCFKNDVQFLRNCFPLISSLFLFPCRELSAQRDVQKADLAQTVPKNVSVTTEANVTRKAASASAPKVSPAAGVCVRCR